MFTKLVAVALSLSMLLSGTAMAAGGIVLAQAGDRTGVGIQSGEGGFTYEQGFLEGERQARGTKAGKFGTGIVVGLLTGLIGTGIGYFIVGSKNLDGMAMSRISDKGSDYQLGFRTAWDEKTTSKKRSSFLLGGLLGTAAFVAILLSANAE